MTTTEEVQEAFASISSILADAISSASASEDPFATLVAHIDQARGFINDMADALGEVEPDPNATGRPALRCAPCIQDARNAEATGQIPLPILPGTTIINGLAVCDVEGRHRVVTAVQHAVAQRSGILLPGQNNGPMPGGLVG